MTAVAIQAPGARQWVWPLLACILACLTGWWRMSEWFAYPIPVDAKYVYLPAAQYFLEQGWAYLLTPDSYRVVPLAYLWSALWGADPAVVRLANAGLWAGCIGFLWQTAYLLGGVRAAVVAVVLLVVHPELPRYFATELTEPIFLLGLFGWIYAVAHILLQGRATWGTVLLGAAMLTVTLLSRPVLQLLAPGCLLLCLVAWAYGRWRSPTFLAAWSHSLAGLAWSLALGMILPVALALKNGMLFGLWGLGTGSGAGLYLGTNPLSQGTEPPFLGLHYDMYMLAQLVSGNRDHLSQEGDRVLRSAALWQFQSMQMMEALHFFGRKLWWWLAHHPSQLDAFGGLLRRLRLFELLTIAAACFGLLYEWIRRGQHPAPRQTVFIGFLLLMLLGMLVQFLPILYNSRYSSASLDPWLLPLAAWGVARITASIRLPTSLGWQGESQGVVAAAPLKTSPWPGILTLGGIVLLTLASYQWTRKHELIAINPQRLGQTSIHVDIADSTRVQAIGMEPVGGEGSRIWTVTQSPAVLEIRLELEEVEHISAAEIFNALWQTELVLSGPRACTSGEAAYRLADGQMLRPRDQRPLRIPLPADGKRQMLVTHANEELRPSRPGSLYIALHCPVGTQVRWLATRLLESDHIRAAAAQLRQQQP